MNEIANSWAIAFRPDRWAFRIWAVIYTFQIIFVVYMALPCSWVPSRNNDLIFGSIGYLFAINMLLNGTWLIVWVYNTPTSMLGSTLIISALLSTGLVILQKTQYDANLNTFEIIILRGGFSIYFGWVTAANIMNIIYTFYSSGLHSNQAVWSKFILVVAYIIYTVYGFTERNPLFSLVLIWVLAAIRSD